ncbi:MAG TPA: hypothetical protein VHH88_09045, partial [Verrucomicrobiae bacterium]|nr:hypothetical protein [Verrucomicrobiae bacterium]
MESPGHSASEESRSWAWGQQGSRESRDAALGIVRILQAAGFAAFWVGGCVRDVLIGREPIDYDIATSALPDD